MKATKFSVVQNISSSLDDLEEVWMEPPSGAEAIAHLYRDLFKTIGLCRGLLVGIESHTPAEVESGDTKQ